MVHPRVPAAVNRASSLPAFRKKNEKMASSFDRLLIELVLHWCDLTSFAASLLQLFLQYVISALYGVKLACSCAISSAICTTSTGCKTPAFHVVVIGHGTYFQQFDVLSGFSVQLRRFSSDVVVSCSRVHSSMVVRRRTFDSTPQDLM